MRASIRGSNNVSRFLLSSQRNAAPPRRTPISKSAPGSASSDMTSMHIQSAPAQSSLTPTLATSHSDTTASHNQTYSEQQEEVMSGPGTKKIIQHFDALSRQNPVVHIRPSSRPLKRLDVNNSRGKSYGSKPSNDQRSLNGQGSISTPADSSKGQLLGHSVYNKPFTHTNSAINQSRNIRKDHPPDVLGNAVSHVDTGKIISHDLIGGQSIPSNQQHTHASSLYSLPMDKSTKGVDSSSCATSSLDELYFRQVQIMQLCLMLTRANIHFEAEKSKAKKCIEEQEIELATASQRHKELSAQFVLERDLSSLEATFGPVRDKLCRVSEELQDIRTALRQCVSADLQNSKNSMIAIDTERLADLEKVVLECQQVAQESISQSMQKSDTV
ncbi:hypothetical protein BGW42_006914 [Actinomortierella wolfii]|nr:hypothetical protein BGW42_006914 [Actinomortierella wolfii]